MAAPGYQPRARNVIRAETVTSDIQRFTWERFDATEDDEFEDGLPLGAALPRRANGYGIDEIVHEAETIMRDAQEEAERLLGDARLKAERERERVYQQAMEQARAEVALAPPGHAEATDELRLAARSLAELTEQLQGAFEQRLAQLEEQLLETAFSIARRVLDRELQADPEVVVHAVREALGRLSSGDVVVRLNPQDLPIVQQYLLELQAERTVGDVISFEEDPRVERGGCLVSGESGSVDVQPGTKLQQLRSLAED
ncbi:MAG: hypothetical protein HUU35_05810 [Armatimonadetes bacterium]|nr:hypothetical protein [Armatimonadota bacterium]